MNLSEPHIDKKYTILKSVCSLVINNFSWTFQTLLQEHNKFLPLHVQTKLQQLIIKYGTYQSWCKEKVHYHPGGGKCLCSQDSDALVKEEEFNVLNKQWR